MEYRPPNNLWRCDRRRGKVGSATALFKHRQQSVSLVLGKLYSEVGFGEPRGTCQQTPRARARLHHPGGNVASPSRRGGGEYRKTTTSSTAQKTGCRDSKGAYLAQGGARPGKLSRDLAFPARAEKLGRLPIHRDSPCASVGEQAGVRARREFYETSPLVYGASAAASGRLLSCGRRPFGTLSRCGCRRESRTHKTAEAFAKGPGLSTGASRGGASAF